MILYTANCNFTVNINGVSRQMLTGDTYESEFEHPELESYIQFGFCSREEVAVQPESKTKKSSKE